MADRKERNRREKDRLKEGGTERENQLVLNRLSRVLLEGFRDKSSMEWEAIVYRGSSVLDYC